MSAEHLSDNYRLRKHFMETNQVPSQSLIKNKMSAPLAAVYFKSMSPKLKVIAGLEPPMKGGGGDWYVPPKDLLEGRTVLKPLKKEYLSNLNYLGINNICVKMMDKKMKCMRSERSKLIAESDERWKVVVETECELHHELVSHEAAAKNTEIIKHTFEQFKCLYGSSISMIENLLFDAACSEIKRIQNEAYQKMQDKYKTILQLQATELYDTYTHKLSVEKLRIRTEFVENLAKHRTTSGALIHDTNVEKQVTIEKLRKYLECQRLACQVYVALKEREECGKEIEDIRRKHNKKAKALKDEKVFKDLDILYHQEKEKALLDFNIIWKKKVAHIVCKFQTFVSYCLSSLPEHADFFINMEKLMLLQLDEALHNPCAESIFKCEDAYKEPTPEPHPFYLFCDKRYNPDGPRLNKDLCPARRTSSASIMPVIVVNKRCLYAACDNFQQFSNKVKLYIHGERGDANDFRDDHIYERDVPVRYSSLEQLKELKLESSLLRVLQQEFPNLGEANILCGICKTPSCFCTDTDISKPTVDSSEPPKTEPVSHKPTEHHVSKGVTDLENRLEPKWESYLKFIEPRKCLCIKTTKKHLTDHLPAYMRQTTFSPPFLPDYEICSLATLRRMVKEARGTAVTPPPEVKVSKTRDVATQWYDVEFENLCTCLSEDELQLLMENRTAAGSKIYHPSMVTANLDVVSCPAPSSLLAAQDASFAMDRVQSLRALIQDEPELEEIFKAGCKDKPFH
uniref:Uncharacterized protein n=1 Tax=Heliothis virescens TaxID=7102 RepID=A0A2A4JTR6_HELVI